MFVSLGDSEWPTIRHDLSIRWGDSVSFGLLVSNLTKKKHIFTSMFMQKYDDYDYDYDYY